MKPFKTKRFLIVVFIVNIWIQVSETFRYLVFVMPKMESSAIIVPEPNGVVLLIWLLWGSLLTTIAVFLFWMYATLFGNTTKTILIATTLSWIFFFVLFWIGICNMGLLPWNFLLITLPLSWLELAVATFIASKLYTKELKAQAV